MSAAGTSLTEAASVLGTGVSTEARSVFQPAVNQAVSLFSGGGASTAIPVWAGEGAGGSSAITAVLPNPAPFINLLAGTGFFYSAKATSDLIGDLRQKLPVFNINNSGASLLGSGYNYGMMGAGSLFDTASQAERLNTNITLPVPTPPMNIFSTPKWQELTRDRGFAPVDPEIANAGLRLITPAHETKLDDHRNVTPIPQEKHWSDHVFTQDYKIDQWDVKPASVDEAPEVYKCGKFGKIYKDPKQKVGNKDIWWSKDTAGHSGQSQGLLPAAYKLFIKTATHFKWIGDADANNKITIENSLPKTHTAVLYEKNGKYLVIDPNNATFSPILVGTHEDIRVCFSNKLQIYKAKDGNIGSNIDQWRDCIDISVKLVFLLQTNFKLGFDTIKVENLNQTTGYINFDSIKNHSAIRETTNQQKIYPKLPSFIEDQHIRVKQSSNVKGSKKATAFLTFLESISTSLNETLEEKGLTHALKAFN